MIPKITFHYSRVYDSIFRDISKKFKRTTNYPSQNQITNYLKKIKQVWKKQERKILISIPKITKLNWKDSQIKVYLVGYCTPYSDPVTMRPYKNNNDFIDILTHALIHQIEHQNPKAIEKWTKYINKKYRKETEETRRHLLLHIVHKKILEGVFNKSRLNRIHERGIGKEYKRAIEITSNDEIIKEFKEVTK